MSSALYGYSGEREASLSEAMAGALRHRGKSWRLDEQVEIAGALSKRSTRAEHEDVASFLAALRGSFVLSMRCGERIHLARDGAGKRSLYYALHEGRLFFASEPKALLAVPRFPRTLRPAAVAQFLSFSFIPGSGTMLEGVSALPPGSFVTFDSSMGTLTAPERYHFPELQEGDTSEESEPYWIGQFDETLKRSVAALCPGAGGEDRAVFLSGGIDSSIVTAALVEQQEARTVHTFSIHFGKRYPNELEFASAVAERCGTRHHEVEITPKLFVPRLYEFVRALDEPIGDPVALPNFELARIVGRDFAEVFNGEGGDPLFGGPKNVPMMLHHWYGGEGVSQSNHRERAYLASYRRCYEELPRLLTPEFRQKIDEERDLEAVLTPYFVAPRPRLMINKLSLINMRLKGAHLILPKVERTLGAHGVSPLSPLFDEELIDLSFRLPPRLKLHRGVEKVIMKRAFAGRLPQEVIDRPKAGMRVPVFHWMQREMKRFARSVLSPKKLRGEGIFNEKRVQQLLDYDIEEGPGRYGMRLWMLLTFQIWKEIVFDEGWGL